jgi:hypothetical protein
MPVSNMTTVQYTSNSNAILSPLIQISTESMMELF